MKKLFKEFKEFISKGSVIDLAIGMIIGSAFTAIVSALVNGILKPLINWIPVSESGLQTVLRPAIVDPTTGAVTTEALILDWGGVISAILTFFITALVLFIIIKVINKVKSAGESAKVKLQNSLQKQTEAEVAAEEANEPEEKEEQVAEPQEVVSSNPTVEELLTEIVSLLKENK